MSAAGGAFAPPREHWGRSDSELVQRYARLGLVWGGASAEHVVRYSVAYDPEIMREALNALASEAGVEVVLRVWGARALLAGPRVAPVAFESRAARQAIAADVVIDAPLMCIQIAKGETVQGLNNYPVGTIFTEPVEELLQLGFWLFDSLFYNLATGVLRRPIGPLAAPMSCKEVIRSYREMYSSNRTRIPNPYFRGFLQDPVVSILAWYGEFRLLLGHRKELGQ